MRFRRELMINRLRRRAEQHDRGLRVEDDGAVLSINLEPVGQRRGVRQQPARPKRPDASVRCRDLGPDETRLMAMVRSALAGNDFEGA